MNVFIALKGSHFLLLFDDYLQKFVRFARLVPTYLFLFCFVNMLLFFFKLEKCLQSESFREGRSGYSKHNIFRQ